MASDALQVRRRPTRPRLPDSQRNSNAVRASVLETALELGLGQNSTVAHWIFNNPLSESEEPEDFLPGDTHIAPSVPASHVADEITPAFTSGSNSTSDESSSLNSPNLNVPSAAPTSFQVHAKQPSITESPHVHFGDFSSDQLQLHSPFVLSSPHDVRGDMGSQDDTFPRIPSRECPSPIPTDTGYTSEGQYLSKGKPSNSKTKSGKTKGNKGSKPSTPDNSKTDEKERDYASDGGYLSASSNRSQGKSPGKVKSRAMAFFRRRSKKPGRTSDDEDEDSIPPVPPIPVAPRPSSPKPLERRVAPSSPRSAFSPLTLNLSNSPASPPRRRRSKSPPPLLTRTPPSQRPDYASTQRSASLPAVPTLAPTIAVATVGTFPPISTPGTPLSTASFPVTSSPPTQLGEGAAPTPKSLTTSSSRQHLGIPPPAPPPTLPLPQPPPSPSSSFNGIPPLPATPSRKSAPLRPIPIAPTTPGSTRPLVPHRAASPFRPLLSPRAMHTTVSPNRTTEFQNGPEAGLLANGKEVPGRQRTGTGLSAGLRGAPAFVQRRIQPSSPRLPPPDVPLPPSPYPAANARPRTPIGLHSKFHEHLSSVSSVPLSHILSTSTSMSMSPSPSMATLSGSSSGPSVRSSHISSASDRSGGLTTHDSSNSRPTTSASTVSEVSYGQPIASTFGRPPMDSSSHLSDQSDVSSGIYPASIPRENGSITTYDDEDADVDDGSPRRPVGEEDDDASVYPSEDKTAGRRTMYLLEHGEPDTDEEDVAIGGSHYWDDHLMPPPVPPLPAMPARPGPGYF